MKYLIQINNISKVRQRILTEISKLIEEEGDSEVTVILYDIIQDNQTKEYKQIDTTLIGLRALLNEYESIKTD
jgi:hypothetical protein